MTQNFCKLFQSEKYGQILVLADTNDEGVPSLMVKFIPDGFGVCGPSFSCGGDDEMSAWAKIDKLLEEFDLEKAEACAKMVCDEIGID